MMPTKHSTFRSQPFFAQGGTLESASVAQAVNDVLLTTTGHGLRLFPIWAVLRPSTSASFSTLRAKGAFLVSAAYDGERQRVGNVTVLSEAGQLCRVLSPWPRDAAIAISVTPAGRLGDKAGEAAASTRQITLNPAVTVGPFGWFEFTTEAGATYSISATDGAKS